jgi:hypothetical protein
MALNKKDENKIAARVYSRIFLVLALVLLVAGGGLWYAGNATVSEVKKEVLAQKLFFPAAGSPTFDANVFPDVQQYAGKQVADIDTLNAYADGFVDKSLLLLSGGKTLTELNAEIMANPQDVALQQQKQMLFEGQVGYAGLKSAYVLWAQGAALVTAGMVTVVGGLVVAGAGAWNWVRSRRA